MTAHDVRTDPIEDYLTHLTTALHGPPRVKARMMGELRENLVDTAADLSCEQPFGEHAARQAVNQFGTVAELAPEFQRELTIAQARHTAATTAALVPFLFLCRHLVQIAGDSVTGRLPGFVQLVAAHLGGVAATTALLGAAFLALTGALARRLPTPQRLPLAVAWTGTTAAAVLALSAITLTLAALLARDLPAAVLAGTLTIICHAKIASSARLCRHCARLSYTEPLRAVTSSTEHS